VINKGQDTIENQNNRLVILAVADKLPDDSFDILAITAPAIAKLKLSNRSFLTLEDLYSFNKSYEDKIFFAKNLDRWMQKCDEVCEQYLNIPRVLSSNGFWILHRLSDLNYIHNIIEIIDSRYEYIELWTDFNVPMLQNPKVDFNSLNMPCFGSGLTHLLIFIKAGLPQIIVKTNRSDFYNVMNPVVGVYPYWLYLKRLPEIIIRRSKKMINFYWYKMNKRSIGNLWVVQNGYDVEILKNANMEWNFNSIINIEITYANASLFENNKVLNSILKKNSNLFFSKHFPRFLNWLNLWFEQYQNNVIFKLNNYQKGLENRLKSSKPKALLYSIGSQNVLEERIGSVANKLNFPIFYFKHNGAAELFLKFDILDQFLQENPLLIRTQFVHSEIEIEKYKDLSDIKTELVGPLFRLANNFISLKSHNKILYSVGPPAHFTFKDMSRIISDYERVNFASSLMNISDILNLKLSIKIHPIEWKVSREMFKILIGNVNNFKPSMITGGSIERIFNKFDLLIIDIIATKVLSVALGLNLPIILYIPINYPINQNTFEDLSNRVYIVQNSKDLEDILTIYKKCGLASKYNEDFTKKYLGFLDPMISMTKVKQKVFKKISND